MKSVFLFLALVFAASIVAPSRADATCYKCGPGFESYSPAWMTANFPKYAVLGDSANADYVMNRDMSCVTSSSGWDGLSGSNCRSNTTCACGTEWIAGFGYACAYCSVTDKDGNPLGSARWHKLLSCGAWNGCSP